MREDKENTTQEQPPDPEVRGDDGQGGDNDAAARPVTTSALSGAISALQQEAEQNRDRLLRVAADFENFKKRSKRDSVDRAQRAEERVVLEFLPVVDNLERAIAHAGTSDDPLLDGVKMVHKQFLATLDKFEIRPFESVGQPFSPERHDAVQQMPADQPANTVCQELQRGYLRGDRLVRAAVVIVSTGRADAPEGAGESNLAGDGDEGSPEVLESEAVIENDAGGVGTGEK